MPSLIQAISGGEYYPNPAAHFDHDGLIRRMIRANVANRTSSEAPDLQPSSVLRLPRGDIYDVVESVKTSGSGQVSELSNESSWDQASTSAPSDEFPMEMASASSSGSRSLSEDESSAQLAWRLQEHEWSCV